MYTETEISPVVYTIHLVEEKTCKEITKTEMPFIPLNGDRIIMKDATYQVVFRQWVGADLVKMDNRPFISVFVRHV